MARVAGRSCLAAECSLCKARPRVQLHAAWRTSREIGARCCLDVVLRRRRCRASEPASAWPTPHSRRHRARAQARAGAGPRHACGGGGGCELCDVAICRHRVLAARRQCALLSAPPPYLRGGDARRRLLGCVASPHLPLSRRAPLPSACSTLATLAYRRAPAGRASRRRCALHHR